MTAKPMVRRQKLVNDINQLAGLAVFGTLSESYRTCGRPNCRCHDGGPKHGPHFQISYRGEEGKTSGYYVPKAAEVAIRRGVDAWNELQTLLRELATMNKDEILAQVREGEPGADVPSVLGEDRRRPRRRPANLRRNPGGTQPTR